MRWSSSRQQTANSFSYCAESSRATAKAVAEFLAHAAAEFPVQTIAALPVQTIAALRLRPQNGEDCSLDLLIFRAQFE